MYYYSSGEFSVASLSYVDAGSVTDVSQVHAVPIFRVKFNRVTQETLRMKQTATLATLPTSTWTRDPSVIA
jgi:hypothetical protein